MYTVYLIYAFQIIIFAILEYLLVVLRSESQTQWKLVGVWNSAKRDTAVASGASRTTSTKPTANKRHPSRQVVPGRGGSRQRWREGREWVIEGEARGLSPGEQHHPLMPSHLLTPHPICLGHVAADHHHPPPLPHTAVLPGRPETEPRSLGFGFLAQTPLPGLALANAWPTRRLCDTNPHPLPPVTTLQLHFTRHTRNRATKARFRVFAPKPAPRPRIGERVAHPPPSWYQSAPTTSCHHPTAPFHAAHPKPSHESSVSGFWAQNPPPGLALANA